MSENKNEIVFGDTSCKEDLTVSVITVVRNMRDTIEETIRSIIAQTYQNIEYVVIDACSTDGTSEILNKYKEFIGVYRREKDESLYHAMNKGIYYCTGELVLFLNGDDYYMPNAVELLVRQKIASGADVVSAQAIEINRFGKEIGKSAYRQYNSTIFLGMPFCHELMLVPKALYKRLGGYNTAYAILADWDFSLRLWKSGCRVSQLRTALMYMRNTGVSITDFESRVVDGRKLLRDNFPFLTPETLRAISDPREWNKELAASLITEYRDFPEFCRIVWDYGFRRDLFLPSDHLKVLLPAQKVPIISIVVPVFNAESTLERALGSILRSRRLDIEIICVDDCSRDKSIDLLKTFSSNDHRIKVYSNSSNRGVAYTRNRGINVATGHYLFFLDADDEAEVEAILNAVGVAEEYNSDVVIGAYETVNPDGRRHIYSRAPREKEIRNSRFYELTEFFFPKKRPNGLDHRIAGEGFTTCIYRTEQVKNIMFRQELNYGEDSLFLLSFLMQAKRISWIDDVVYRIFITPGSAMSQFHAKRFIDAIQWRLWISQLLMNEGMDEFAKFICCKYWSKDFGKKLADAELEENDRNRINELFQQLIAVNNQVPNFDYNWNFFFRDSHLENNKKVMDNKAKSVTKVSDNITRPLRVNIFIATDGGGAAIGSLRRQRALQEIGVDARILTGIKNHSYKDCSELVGLPNKRQMFKQEIMTAISGQDFCISSELFSSLGSIVSYQDNMAHFDEPDVIHFHWVTGIIDEKNWDILRGKAFCWTMADMNAFTGGCHYSEGCNEYQKSCQNCPLLTRHKEIAADQWMRKKRLYDMLGKFTVICPSRWIADRARESSLFRDKNIIVIPNAMPVEDFKPINQLVARLKLGLPLKSKVLLFGAEDVSNRRKGGDIMRKAMDLLAEKHGNADIHIATFGHHSLQTPFPVSKLGYLKTEQELSLAYSAADCFCLPSREDNAPLTVAESLLCGTPVVATPVGNVPEIVVHKKTGFVCADFSPESLLEGIVFVLKELSKRDNIALQSEIRKVAYDFHNPLVAAERHKKLYLSMLSYK